ncbi:hypothetical protein Tco_0829281 [Tanacetum coccineum]
MGLVFLLSSAEVLDLSVRVLTPPYGTRVCGDNMAFVIGNPACPSSIARQVTSHVLKKPWKKNHAYPLWHGLAGAVGRVMDLACLKVHCQRCRNQPSHPQQQHKRSSGYQLRMAPAAAFGWLFWSQWPPGPCRNHLKLRGWWERAGKNQGVCEKEVFDKRGKGECYLSSFPKPS